MSDFKRTSCINLEDAEEESIQSKSIDSFNSQQIYFFVLLSVHMALRRMNSSSLQASN